ncbi:MAG: hypothetical protein HOO06_08060 [Bdellovibrionaceae bacterium]|jgi:hypothetical protein|nr:hypothetical protein [Pseudobdellovibrionaceae bacterium]
MSERRKSGERDLTDRRIIERFSNVKIRDAFVQIRTWVKILFVLCILAAVYQIGYGFYAGGQQMGIGFLYGTFFIFITTYLYRYQDVLSLFLENDSVTNLENTIEKELSIWVLVGLISILVVIISLLSLL